LVIILVMMQVSKKVPFDDPDTLNMVRALYVVSNVIIFGLYFYVQMQINKKKGMSHLPPPPTYPSCMASQRC
jgi:hypothetical protein